MRMCWEHPMQPNSKWGPCEKSSGHIGNPSLHVVPRCRFTYRLVAAPQVNNQLSSPSLTKSQLNPGKKIPGKHACRTQSANPVSQLRALQTPWRKLLRQSRALCAGQVSCTAQLGEHFERDHLCAAPLTGVVHMVLIYFTSLLLDPFQNSSLQLL